MEYKTILVKKIAKGIEVVLNRVEKKNAINNELLTELNIVLDEAEKDPSCRIIVLKGQKGMFCYGMDFEERVAQSLDQGKPIPVMKTLKRFASTSKIIISIIEGQVIAGGVGLVAASDLVIATSASYFSLTEAMWGLLPANILPFIIRRVGFQKAYAMTLTTRKIDANEALSMGLIDFMSDDPDKELSKQMVSLLRVSEETVLDLKQYFRKLWIINEKMEKTASDELERLVQEPRVIENIKNYVEKGKFPWE